MPISKNPLLQWVLLAISSYYYPLKMPVLKLAHIGAPKIVKLV